MAEQRAVHIPFKEGDDKRAIKVIVNQSLSGKMLLFQIIYTKKTEICIPKNATGKENFLFL